MSHAAIEDALSPGLLEKKVWKGLTVGVLVSFITGCSSLFSAVIFYNELRCEGAPGNLSQGYLVLAICSVLGCLASSFAHYKALKQDSVRWSYVSQQLDDVCCLVSLPPSSPPRPGWNKSPLSLEARVSTPL